jgi:branched-chain amino acid aminotransferase
MENAKPVIKPYTPFCWIHQLGFHYGQAIFEGMKAYKDNQDAVWLLDLMKTISCFNNSAVRMAMPEVPKMFLWTKSIAKAR